MTAALHVIATRVRLRVVRPCFISGQRRRLGDVCTVWRREAELLLNDGLAVDLLAAAGSPDQRRRGDRTRGRAEIAGTQPGAL